MMSFVVKGIDFKMKTLAIENTTVKMQLWDTAG